MHFVLRVSLRLLKIALGDFGSALPKRYTSVTAAMATSLRMQPALASAERRGQGHRRAGRGCHRGGPAIPALAGKTRRAVNAARSFFGPSPRSRGKRELQARGGGNGRSIPALAGKTQDQKTIPHPEPVHPRARGENRWCSTSGATICGPSPRSRGKLYAEVRINPSFRSIPALAGKTLSYRRFPRLYRGPSPRSRGKRSGSSGGTGTRRSIPALAGKTLRRGTTGTRLTVHPRARGENIHRSNNMNFHKRSIPALAGKTRPPSGWPSPGAVHPRARGENHVCCSFLRTVARSIPALAGKTPARIPAPCRCAVHPRARGENEALTKLQYAAMRSIPALAGKTSCLIVCRYAALSVHPRARGENGTNLRFSVRPVGPSPRSRGKRADRLQARCR